jgi:predicted  nucleic acid-binding Zn-ribbon protein
MSLGQNFECDQKSIILSQEIKSLKHEPKMLQVQLTKEKQAQIGLEKQLTTTEDVHIATKANFASASQNMQEMFSIYHDKLRQMKEK